MNRSIGFTASVRYRLINETSLHVSSFVASLRRNVSISTSCSNYRVGVPLLQVLLYFYNPILQIIIWTHSVYFQAHCMHMVRNSASQRQLIYNRHHI